MTNSAPMADPPKRLPFGGKGPKALPWKPLPHMQEYLDNLTVDEKTQGYILPATVGLKHFGIFAAEEGVKHPGEIERHHILRFQAYLATVTKENGEPLSLSYRQQLLKYVRAWINWLQDVEHIDHNPWVRIRVGKQVKKPKPLEEDEVELLFQAHRQQAFSIPAFYFHRREVILVLLYGWGLRIHELQSLSLSQMDMRLDWVTVRNKGGGTKTLPYGSEMKTVVQRWMRLRAQHAKPGEDALLVDQKGNQLSVAMIRKIVVECGNRAGIAINPHRLRDTFGTTMLDHDVPVERIMKMMGHTQRSQTLAYARVNEPKIKESHDAVINPLINKLLGGQVP